MPTIGSLFAEHWKNRCFKQNMEITYNLLFSRSKLVNESKTKLITEL